MRLLLYYGCHKVESFYSSEAKQLTRGFSIVLLGSNLRGKQPRDYLPDFATLNAQSTRHRARPGPKACAVVYRRAPCVPRSRERQKRPTGAGAKRANVQNKTHWYMPSNSSFQPLRFRDILVTRSPAKGGDFQGLFMSAARGHPGQVATLVSSQACYFDFAVWNAT